MEQKLEVIRAVVKTDEISTSEAQPAAKIRLAAREADLGVWLVKTLDDREPGEHGYAYVMPNDANDIVVVLPNIQIGAPVASVAAHPATREELNEVVKAMGVLGDVERVSAYLPSRAIIWRGTADQREFAIWMLRQFSSPPATDWIEPISTVLADAHTGVVDLFYFPSDVASQDFQEIVSAVASKVSSGRVTALTSERIIGIRGTEQQLKESENVIQGLLEKRGKH